MSVPPVDRPTRPLFRAIRGAAFWGVPPLVLYLILRRIDPGQLAQLAANANWLLILAGIAMQAPTVVLGALRWHFLMRHYGCASLPLATSLAEYWRSVALTVFAPGSFGSDAYRVMVMARQRGYYLRSAFIVGVEKLAALFTCAVLIAALYPLLAPSHLPGVVAELVDVLYALFLLAAALATSVMLVRRHAWTRRLADAVSTRLESLARRVASLASIPPTEKETSSPTTLALMLSAFSPAVAVPAVATSLAIYVVAAAQSQVFFQAFGYSIPYSINLFISPLLFLLYSLPISFGGLGIREGAFILAYGAFGVPAETSLIVSFCGLLGTSISYAIGASLFLPPGRQRVRSPL